MAKKKKRYRDSYEAIKSCQYAADMKPGMVNDYDVDDMLNCMKRNVNKRQRFRIGHVETRRER